MEAWMPWIWGGVILFSLIAEAATAGLVTVWFIPAGAAALALSFMDVNFWWQIAVFGVLSGLFLLFARPILSKFLQKEPFTPTNADMLIGKTAVVTEELGWDRGAVKVCGQVWSARLLPEDGAKGRAIDEISLPEGSKVTVCAIEGVKLLVTAEKDGA